MSIDAAGGKPQLALSGTGSRAEQEQLADIMAAYVKLLDAQAQHAAVLAIPGDEAFVRLQNKMNNDQSFKEAEAPGAAGPR